MADTQLAIPQSLIDFIDRNKIDLDKVTDDQLRNGVKIANSAVKYELNPDFPLSMAWQESEFKSDAKNKKSTAYGPMQLVDATAKGLGVDSKDVDQNIDGGMRLIKELMANKRIGNDPNKVLAGYHSGPSSKFIDTGDFNDLDDAEAKHLNAVLGYSGGDELPSLALGAQISDEQGDVAGVPITGPAPGEHVLSPTALSALGGGAGLAVGAGVTGARKTANIVRDIYGRAFPTGQTPTSSVGATLNQAVNNATGNTPEQIARILQGGEGDTAGTTGRARQEGYNVQTSQAAATKKAAEEAAQLAQRAGITELDAKQFLARQPGLTSSPAGIIYPREAPRPTTGARTYGPAPIAAQAAQSGSMPIAGSQPYTVGGGRPSPMPSSPIPSAAATATPGSSMMGTLGRYAGRAAEIAKPLAHVGVSGLSGALGANQIYNADMDRAKNGLTPSNAIDYLSGAGGVLGMYPSVPTQAAAAAMQVPAAVRDVKRWVEENPKQVRRLVDLGVFDQIPGQP